MNSEEDYNRVLAYGQSKLANVLFAQELSQRVLEDKILVNAIHPGAVYTELTRHYLSPLQWLIDFVFKHIMHDSDSASMTQLYTAVSPELIKKRTTGKYFIPIAAEAETSEPAKDKNLQKGLWTLTEQVLKEKGF